MQWKSETIYDFNYLLHPNGESQQLYELSRPCLIKTHVQGSTCLKTQIYKKKIKHKNCKMRVGVE